ncbi:MAG: tRNA 2-thiocytidine biosynthesis protein TtcA [Clostridiales bacterium]|nr:tRNA 2-thiocytidine biosynthesis protein TtcA [Candidatus Blautia equi]
MKIQKLYSYLRQAIDEYEMIQDGDRIALGISGGKDSLTLLYGLAGLRRFYPKKFELIAITVDLGYEGFDLSKIQALCDTLEVEYHIVHTQIKDMVPPGECSLCARLRKGAFNNKAKELNCNKIAYAHNQDDVVETLMMSMIYEGRISTFWPVTHFDDTDQDVIRPLMYAPLSEIRGFQNKYDLPVSKNPCPYDKTTQRTYVRELLRDINHHAPGAVKRIMTGIRNANLEGWEK